MKIDNSMKFFVGNTAATKILLGSTLLWPLIVSERNKIIYTSTDGNIVTPYKTDVFGANIISNEYEGGIGVITFDGDVTTIGDYAFLNCDSITSLTIPDGVTSIGNGAFSGCDSITNVTIPDGVTTIGENAFAYCGLTSVTIPDNVTSIENGTFSGCDLTSVTIPDSVTSIGQGAFSNCDRLRSVTIGNGVTTIGYYAFSSCGALTYVYCKATTPPALGGTSVFDGSLYGGKIYVPYKSVNAYESAEYWSEYADEIVVYHFEEVPSNNEIWYTSSDGLVVNIYSGKFGVNIISNTCINDQGVITFDGDVTTIGDDAFSWSNYLTSVTIPNSVTTIGKEAFEHCSLLLGVNIPDSVTTIGESAFFECYKLRSVTIGNSVTTIGDKAFGYCESLTSLTIPDSVTTIGKEAFLRCSLKSVTIPDSVTTIGDKAFYAVGGLKSIYCKATTPPALGGTYVFDYNGSGRKIYVPTESVEAYKSAEYWSRYASAIVGYDFDTIV